MKVKIASYISHDGVELHFKFEDKATQAMFFGEVTKALKDKSLADLTAVIRKYIVPS